MSKGTFFSNAIYNSIKIVNIVIFLLLPELLTGASAKSRPFGQNSGNFRFLERFMHTSGVFRVPNRFANLSGCFLNTFVRSGGTEAMIRHHSGPKYDRIQSDPPLAPHCNCIRKMMKIRKIFEKIYCLVISFSCLLGLYARSEPRNGTFGTFSNCSIEQNYAIGLQKILRSLGPASKTSKSQ